MYTICSRNMWLSFFLSFSLLISGVLVLTSVICSSLPHPLFWKKSCVRCCSSCVSHCQLLFLGSPTNPGCPLWCFLCVTRWKLNILKDPPHPQHPSPHKLHIPALIPLQSMSFTPDYYPPYHCDHPHPYSLCPPLQIILHDTTHTHTYSSHMHTHQDIEKDFAE